MHADEARVIYQGDPTPQGLAGGETGRVLVGDERNAHVMWSTGSRAGQVDVIRQDDLTSQTDTDARVAAYVSDSIAVADLGSTFDAEGAEAVLAQMMEEGSLSRLTLITEEVVEWIATRVRTLGPIREAAAILGDGADDLVDAAVSQVLRDATESMEEA